MENIISSYSKDHLLQDIDPPHFTKEDGTFIVHPVVIEDYAAEENFVVVRPWEITVGKVITDEEGWTYADSFDSNE